MQRLFDSSFKTHLNEVVLRLNGQHDLRRSPLDRLILIGSQAAR